MFDSYGNEHQYHTFRVDVRIVWRGVVWKQLHGMTENCCGQPHEARVERCASGEHAIMSVSYERWFVAMTTIESLPGYAEAEAVAKARGSNVVDMVSA